MNFSSSVLLLDTNIVVHLIRGDKVCQRIVKDYGLRNRPERPLISFVTLGEIHALALKRGWESERRERLNVLFEELVIVKIHHQGIVEAYAQIDYFSEKVVKPARQLGKNDIWIAATTAYLDLWLMTTDTDFDDLHGRYLNRIKIDVTLVKR